MKHRGCFSKKVHNTWRRCDYCGHRFARMWLWKHLPSMHLCTRHKRAMGPWK